MNRAMRKHMLKSVLYYTSTSTSTSGSSSEVHRLLDLMHAVSRTYNASSTTTTTTTTTTSQDFKAHWKSQFYLGPALSGAPFHHHGPAFNLLMHGRKEWTLLPPGMFLSFPFFLFLLILVT